ncbi:MAG TPA: GDSL-type esterase/lipase family protein [Chthoniobacteraceae bacterium]|jgi:lysophospholipase L1-like esterase|nr:GDSL-type esterase/lipase family protein [Chthoniobacteraceae bacterium]
MTASEIETDLEAFGHAPAPEGATVFYGSSSIRMWDDLAGAFPGIPVINRGFGGSTLAECVWLLPRLIEPLRPARLILYAADNDLEQGASPEHVVYLFRQFIAWVRNHFPTMPVAFLSVKPSPARFWNIGNIRRANELIEGASGELPDVSFINLFPLMLSPSGGPRPELFTEDGLHMNPSGYDLWTKQIRGWLDGLPPG